MTGGDEPSAPPWPDPSRRPVTDAQDGRRRTRTGPVRSPLLPVGGGLVLLGVAALWVLGWTSGPAEATRAAYAGVSELRVSTDAGDVTVVAGGADTVDVTVTTHRFLRGPEVSVERDGVALVLRTRCPGLLGWNPAGRCAADYVVSAPPGTRVLIESRDGSLAATGMRAPASLRSGAGDVQAADHEGDLTLATGAGRVVANDVASGAVDARSGEGDVLVLARTPPRRLTASTGAGDVGIAVPAGRYAVRAETGAGADAGTVDISGVGIDAGAARRIEASTQEGDVIVGASR